VTHLSREELLSWRDRGATGDRDRVVSHLAACGACAATYAELTRTAVPPTIERTTHFDPADFVSRGYAVQRRMRPAQSMFRLSWKVWTGTLSAAVVVIVTLAGMLVVTRQSRPAFETLSGRSAADSGGARLTVAFHPNATEEAIRQALLDVHGAIVSGPSATGIYIVKLATPENDGTATNAAIERLRSRSGIVRFVERQP
jgi:hypothetical protein